MSEMQRGKLGFVVWVCVAVWLVGLFGLACESIASDEPDGDVQDGDVSDGDVPDGDTSDGDVTDGDVPDGDTSDGDVTDGDEPDGDVDGDEDSDDEGESEYELPACREGGPSPRTLAFQSDETFDFGPYLMSPGPTSMTIMWRSLEEGDSRVFLGQDPETLEEITSMSESVQVHRVTLEDLEPDTRYYYKVQTGEMLSQVHAFHTAVEPGQSFRFAVWGDNQNGPENFVNVVAGIAAQHPHVLLGVGDHVQDGSKFEDWQQQLFHPARALFHEVAFYGAMGNHERSSSQYKEFYYYPNSINPGQTDSNFTFTYGNAFFLVIDTEKLFFPIGDTDTSISAWIKEQVASPQARAATWRFAFGHQPGYSEAWGDGDCRYDGYGPLRTWFLPFLEENGFHAYFSGHMHGYERGSVGGLMHIITGGGGGSLDAWCKNWDQTTVAHYEHNFLKVTADCDTLSIEALYPDGTRFDWVVLSADSYGEIVEQGPVEDLPPPTVNSAATETPPGR